MKFFSISPHGAPAGVPHEAINFMAARGNPGGPTGGAGGGYPRPPPPPQAAAAGNGSQGNNGAPPPPPPSAANEATNHLSAGFGGYGSPQVSTVLHIRHTSGLKICDLSVNISTQGKFAHCGPKKYLLIQNANDNWIIFCHCFTANG